MLGIDFGSQFYKAVLVKPGSPFQIVENTSSQRKTENAMIFTEEERLFEKSAISQSVGYPKTSMLGSLNLLGLEYNDQNLETCRNEYLYTSEFLEDERGLIGYEVNFPGVPDLEGVRFHIEEVIAMILKHTKKLVKVQSNENIQDITLTVPSYFTINQRLMLIDAVELAGFKVLSLVHENTAAALMYGIDKNTQVDSKKVMMINMGSSDLEISIVHYEKVKAKSKGKDKDILSVHVLSESSAPGIGGNLFDAELVKILTEKFDSLPEREGKESVFGDEKIKRRLMREVPKLKEILSANKETPVKIVELADLLNLEFILTREEFENRIAPLIEDTRPAFEKILSKHPIDTIDDIEILGGGLRVPKIKEFISEVLSNKDLNTHMNPDEAMGFGTAYIAANFSTSYQVQKVYLYQPVPYSVFLNFTQADGCEGKSSEECFTKHLKLYDEDKNVLGQKKTIGIDNHVEKMDYVLYKINEDGSEQKVIL